MAIGNALWHVKLRGSPRSKQANGQAEAGSERHLGLCELPLPDQVSLHVQVHGTLRGLSPYLGINASASMIRSLFPDSSISFHGESPDLDHEISKAKNDERISCLEQAVSSPWLLTEEGATAQCPIRGCAHPEQSVRSSCEIFAAAPTSWGKVHTP